MSEKVQNKMLVQLTVDELRELIRAEVAASKKTVKLLYTTDEAAELCGVKLSWLAWAARTGRVNCRRLGHNVRFTLEDLHDLIEQSKAAGEEQERKKV
jgi:excisionase family DNA binding protein